MIFSLSKSRCASLVGITRLVRAVKGTHSTVVDNPVDSFLHLGPTMSRARNLALSEWTAIGRGQELHSAVRLGFDTSEVFSLSTDDKTDKA